MTAGFLGKASSRRSPGNGQVRSDRAWIPARGSSTIIREGAVECPHEDDVTCEECKRCDLGARE